MVEGMILCCDIVNVVSNIFAAEMILKHVRMFNGDVCEESLYTHSGIHIHSYTHTHIYI